MRRYRHFVTRTIRDGKVRIYGETYEVCRNDPRPHSAPYTGQLDGQRWCFGLYLYPTPLPYVALWGSELRHRTPVDQWDGLPKEANITPDGYIQWDVWDRVGA